MPRQSRKSSADRKAEIVQTAIRLAGEYGPDRVTTQLLADAVGITQPAIFRHFPAKTEIWQAVGEHITRTLAAEKIDDGGPDPARRLKELVIAQLGYIARTPALPAILFSRELHAENEPLRRHFETMMTRRREGFASLARRAVETGQVRADLDPMKAAGLVLAVIQGLAMRWSLENRTFDLAFEGELLLTCVFDGFRA
jgi:AcrR family transcriptional regulator